MQMKGLTGGVQEMCTFVGLFLLCICVRRENDWYSESQDVKHICAMLWGDGGVYKSNNETVSYITYLYL